jgi:PAS domain S-box-containing protein
MTDSTPRASVLLVDDHAPNLLALRVILEDLGAELVECRSGEAALQKIEHTEFAVVLLDVRMPGLSGFETAQRIRELDRRHRLPIIFLSANDVDTPLLEEGYELGAVDFLVKPLIPVIVRAKVREFVEMWHAQQRARREAEQLRLLVDSARDYAIFLLTPDGHVATWNPGAQRIKQYSAAEIIGQHFSKFYPPDAIARDWPAHELRVAASEGRFEDEGWRIRKDGTQFWANVIITALRDDEGVLRGFSKITRDMTERKRNEENAFRLQEETAARRAAEEHARVVQQHQAQLAASERRHRLLAELAASTQALVEPERVMETTARLLAEFLDVDRCAYAEVEGETTFHITGNFTRGVPSIVGRWPVASFGQACAAAMRAGEPYVVSDVDDDARILPSDLPAYRATQICSAICVPLHKNGQLIAAMAVHQQTPRAWTSDEVDLVSTVVGRCWEALERSRMARNLLASEAKFRAIVDTSPECVKLVAPDGTLIQMNPSGLAMVEADESAIGTCVYNVVAPEFRDAFSRFNEQVCSGQPGVLQFDIIGQRGTRRHMETTAVPLPHGQGRFMHLAVTRDVTHRTIADRALADSRARLDYAARIAGVGFWYCDLPFDVLIWDERVREHFWMTRDEVVTIDSFYDRLHPEDRELTRQAIARSIDQHGPYDIDYRTVDPRTGDVKWIRAIGGTTYGPTGEPIRFDGVTVDVTAKKLTEEQLTQALRQEQQHARLLQNLAAAALTIHSSNSLESVLDVVTEEARQIVGCHLGVTRLTGDQDSAETTASAYSPSRQQHDFSRWSADISLAALLANGKRPLRRPADSSPAASQLGQGLDSMRGVMIAPLVGRRGKLLGFIQLSDKQDGDFSERDEAILVQLSHIAAVAIENARLNAELRLQDRRKDEFLATLAHELRNPLAPIRNSLEILKLPQVEPEIAQQTREMMERQIQHLIRLVDDLLDVSRVMRGKIELRREVVELPSIVARAVETAQPLLTAQRQELTLSLPPAPLRLHVDPVRLSQVLGNLLTNAAKYTDAGGRIWVSAQQEQEQVVISVRDNGMGISPQLLPRVFELFVQADPTATRSQGGLGIGLTLAKNLVELHQGKIEAHSAGVGQGAEFRVRLPLFTEPAATRRKDDRPSLRGASPGYRLLVVDDNQDAARSLAMLFKLQGHEVKVAHDGLSALNLVETFLPDVVFLDLGMPGMDGFEVARRLRQKPAHARTVLAALTGWGQREDRQRTADAGFDHHFVKPVEPKAIAWLFEALKNRPQ